MYILAISIHGPVAWSHRMLAEGNIPFPLSYQLAFVVISYDQGEDHFHPSGRDEEEMEISGFSPSRQAAMEM